MSKCQGCLKERKEIRQSRPSFDVDFSICDECAKEFDETGFKNIQTFWVVREKIIRTYLKSIVPEFNIVEVQIISDAIKSGQDEWYAEENYDEAKVWAEIKIKFLKLIKAVYGGNLK